MKCRTVAVVSILSLATLLWGCDMANLPTQTTPVPIVSTPTALPDTPTPEPPSPTLTVALPTSSATPVPATEEPSPTATVEPPAPTETPEPEQGSPTDTPEPVPTRPPRPTRTPGPSGPTATPRPQPTSPDTGEAPPAGGWGEVVRVPPGNHRIAITFDAGASGETWPRILAAFRERNLRITMFITGRFAEQYPDAIKQAAADGHEISNHTYSHLDSRKLSDEELAGELARTEAIIRDLAGVSTKPYWRPPFGARNNHVLNVAVAQGYRSIYWTLDSLDSVGQPKTADFIFNRVTNTPGVNLDGAIILQHFGSEASADALPRELDRLKEMGLQVVTISELLSP
jgi:peptidoglycan-N-acetylmuramic acid deacetylase